MPRSDIDILKFWMERLEVADISKVLAFFDWLRNAQNSPKPSQTGLAGAIRSYAENLCPLITETSNYSEQQLNEVALSKSQKFPRTSTYLAPSVWSGLNSGKTTHFSQFRFFFRFLRDTYGEAYGWENMTALLSGMALDLPPETLRFTQINERVVPYGQGDAGLLLNQFVNAQLHAYVPPLQPYTLITAQRLGFQNPTTFRIYADDGTFLTEAYMNVYAAYMAVAREDALPLGAPVHHSLDSMPDHLRGDFNFVAFDEDRFQSIAFGTIDGAEITWRLEAGRGQPLFTHNQAQNNIPLCMIEGADIQNLTTRVAARWDHVQVQFIKGNQPRQNQHPPEPPEPMHVCQQLQAQLAKAHMRERGDEDLLLLAEKPITRDEEE